MTDFFELEQYGARVALLSEAQSALTYRELAARCNAFQPHLRPNRLAFVLCQNTPSAVVCYLACLRAGCAAALIDSTIHPALLKALRETYRPAFILAPSAREDAGQFGAPQATDGSHVLYADSRATPNDGIHPSLALLLTTSGSTGSPKLVRLSRQNLTANATSICEYLSIAQDDRAVTTMPMSYAYGLSIINSHLTVGASIVMNESSVLQRPFWKLVVEAGVTTFGGVPYTYQLLKRLKFEDMKVPQLKTLTQAGGRLDPELSRSFAQACARKGIRFVTMYGQTEATARMAYVPPAQAVEGAGTIGVAIPGGELWLENEQGAVITSAEVEGELVFRGANVSLGYATHWRDLSLGDENQGVLRTGDLARLSSNGLYTLVGRKTRFAKIFGNRINLDEVEALCRQMGFECACLASADALRLFCVGNEPPATLPRRLSDLTRLPISAFQVVPISEIPRSAAGKVLYSQLPEAES